MKIEFDPVRSDKNDKERGLPFDMAEAFEWATAVYLADSRRAYGEDRIRAFGFIDDRVHALVFKPIPGGVRIISLRKANMREVGRYEKEIEPQND
jgi:uncharacterized DUF497 family protein